MEKQKHTNSTNNLFSDMNAVIREMAIIMATYLTNRRKAAFLLWSIVAFIQAGFIMLVYICLANQVINAVTVAVIMVFNSICISLIVYLHIKVVHAAIQAKQSRYFGE